MKKARFVASQVLALIALSATAQAAPKDTMFVPTAICTGTSQGMEMRFTLMIDGESLCSKSNGPFKAMIINAIIDANGAPGATREWETEATSAKASFLEINGEHHVQFVSQAGSADGKFSLSMWVTFPDREPASGLKGNIVLVTTDPFEGRKREVVEISCNRVHRLVECGDRR